MSCCQKDRGRISNLAEKMIKDMVVFFTMMARATVIHRDASKLDNINMDLVVEDDDLNCT